MTDTLPNGSEQNPQNIPSFSATRDGDDLNLQNTPSITASDEAESVFNRLLSHKTVPVLFTGKKMEYFKLWLVNALLSIITLGIYSAWAKVRNTQYLYGHTQVDGHRLAYLAKPKQILIGRIIAVVVFVLYGVLSSINPLLNGICVLLLLVAYPWLINAGMRFTMRNTAYRNVRFAFRGSYGGALVNFILLPLLGMITAGLAMPWVLKKLHQYIYQNISFGGKAFRLNSSTKHYYLIALALLGAGLAFGLVFMAFAMAFPVLDQFRYGGLNEVILIPVIMVVYLFTLSVIGAIFYAMIYNHILANLQIEEVVAFKADLKIASFSWLNLSNTLLLIFTLGLAYPVTQIRKNQMLANATQVTLFAGIDTLVNTVEDDKGAFGEEAAGIFDVDLSLT